MSATNLVSFLFSRPNAALFQDQYFDKQPNPVTKQNDPRTPEKISRSTIWFTENESRYTLLLTEQQNDPLILIDFSSVQKAKNFWESLQRKAEYTFKAFGWIALGIFMWRIWRDISNQPLSNATNQITKAAALACVCFAMYVKIRSFEFVSPLGCFPKNMNGFASQINQYRNQLFAEGLKKYLEATDKIPRALLDFEKDMVTEQEKAFLIERHLTQNKVEILRNTPNKSFEEWYKDKITPGLNTIFGQNFIDQKDKNLSALFEGLFDKVILNEDLDAEGAYNQFVEKALTKTFSDALVYCDWSAQMEYQRFLYIPQLQAQLKSLFASIPSANVTEAKEWIVDQVSRLNGPKVGPAKKFLTESLQFVAATEENLASDVFL